MLVPFPNPPVQDHAAIRAAMLALLSARGRMELVIDKIFQADDIALLFSSWTLSGTGPDGSAMKVTGQTTDVVRRQADGTWLFVLDVPQGAAAAKQP